MRRILYLLALLFSVATLTLLVAQNQRAPRQISLPTSKVLTVPSPGVLGSLNGFAAAMTVSPDGRYAAILNDGYGSQQNQAHQSIAILDLSTNRLADFPEDRLPEEAHQSYFVGLAFSSDGQHLYASIGSITDPTGEKPGDTGNGIAVYRFHDGQITWDRFIKIPPQNIAPGKKVAQGVHKTAEGTVLPYPAGLAVISSPGAADRLLIANNLSDNVVLLDSASGHVLKRFDVSTHEMIPSSFPYAVVASRDGRRAWCSLWNASRVAELDLEKGTVARWIPLLESKEPTAPGSHPTAMLLSRDEKSLYVALSNANRVAVVSTETGKTQLLLDTTISGEKYGGTYPNALALSADGERLFVADAAIDAIAVFYTHATFFSPTRPSETPAEPASGFIPTDWYPTALATVGNDLLLATSKGQGTGPNNSLNNLKNERRHREHPYIPTLLYGSIARLKIQDIEKHLPEFTRTVEESNLLHSSPPRTARPTDRALRRGEAGEGNTRRVDEPESTSVDGADFRSTSGEAGLIDGQPGPDSLRGVRAAPAPARILYVLAPLFGFLVTFQLRFFRFSLSGLSLTGVYPYPNLFDNVTAQVFRGLVAWMLPRGRRPAQRGSRRLRRGPDGDRRAADVDPRHAVDRP